jgi:hypothetical protein
VTEQSAVITEIAESAAQASKGTNEAAKAVALTLAAAKDSQAKVVG